MKKILIFLILLWVGRVAAQVTETTEGGDIQQTMNTLFQNVNTDNAPYGFLMNKAIYFDNIHKYDGVTISDSTDVNINTFGWLYTMLGMANIGTNEIPDAETLYGEDSYAEGNPIPLVVMCERYGHFTPTVFDDNLIRYENEQLFDVSGRTEDPYTASLVFVATPIVNKFKTGNLSFVLSADRIVQNVGNIQSFSIDFGSGFQTVTLGEPFTVSLPTGMTRAVMQLRLRRGRGFQTLKCRFEIEVVPSVANTPVPESGGPDAVYTNDNSLSETISDTRPQDGTKLIIAEVTTFYACADGQLRKPLFILDGFNSGTEDNVNEDGVKTEDFLRFFNGYTNTPITTVLDRRAITQDLRKEGYDLIFVNWRSEEGRDDMRRNAYLLQKIIATMNTRKSINKSIEKNVIIGLSMGGVIAKYALLDLERQNPNAVNGGHDMKLLITYDSPMQGANIPLGFQYLVKDLGDQVLGGALGRNIGGLKKGLKSLKSSAARQLLTYQAFDPNPKFPLQFTSFYNELNAMGKPQKCDYKTVSNGSMVGTPNFPAGKQLLGGGTPAPIVLPLILPATGFAIHLRLDVRTLPPTSPNNQVIYDRTLLGYIRILGVPIPYTLAPRLTILVKDMRPLDGAPGGTTGLTGGLNIPFVKGGKYDDGNREDLRTTFIPTVSALDIKSPLGDNVFLNVSNEQTLLANQTVGSNGIVGSRSSNQFDVAIDFDASQNRVANQSHVGLSYRTTGFLLYELITRDALKSTTSNTTYLRNRVYNFGASASPFPLTPPSPGNFQAKAINNIIDYTVNVEDNGQIWVNRSGKVGFTDLTTNPNNGTSTDYSLIIRKAEGCKGELDRMNGIVNIQNTGTVLVADGSINNTSNIKIRDGGTINVLNGGNLTLERSGTFINVENGGELVIEAGGNLNLTGIGDKIIVKQGGKLIINGGANINLTGFNTSILIEFGGELVINGTMYYTGVGYFQFDERHKLTLNSDLVLTGSGKTNTLIKLTDAPPGTENKLVINERSVNISEAKISYGINSQIEITHNASGLEVIFTDAAFEGTYQSTSKGINCINITNVTLTRCDFKLLSKGLLATKTNDSHLFTNLYNCTFAKVNDALSVLGEPNLGRGNTGATINNCSFDYTASLFLISGTACRFENVRQIDMSGNVFSAYPAFGNWGNYTAIELKNTELYTYDNNIVSYFKTGINAENGQNSLWFYGGIDINNCETGILLTGSPIDDSYGILALWCAKIKNNLVGIKGTNIRFEGGDGRQLGAGNEFQNASNGLLFDICYPVWRGSSFGFGTINASNNYWEGGFDNMKFNLMFGQGAGCLNSGRRSLEQCSVLSTPPTGNCSASTNQCCNAVVYTNDGLNGLNNYTNQCFAGGGSSDALMMKNTTNQATTKADKDIFKAYPNPANETVKLDIEGGDYHLRVLNTVGQTIFTQNTEGPLSVNVATWTNGIYLFELTDKATNKQQRSKIIVQH